MGNRDSLPVTESPKEGANSVNHQLPDDYLPGSIKMTSQGNSMKAESPSGMSNAATEGDPLKGEEGGCLKRGDGLKIIIISTIVFAVAITVALIIQIYVGEPQVPPHGAVTSSVKECSEIGVQMLKSGGNAVDAALATMFCVGLYHPHKSGLGGGGFMLIYDKKNHLEEVIDFRETCPSAVPKYVDQNLLQGVKSIAVPGELAGMYMATKYGKKPWEDLIKPSIQAARKGVRVTKSLAKALEELNPKEASKILSIFSQKDVPLKENDTLMRPDLAGVFEELQKDPIAQFYQKTIAADILKSTSGAVGGYMNAQDLIEYNSSLRSPIRTEFKDYTILTTPAPSEGPLLLLMLNILENEVLNVTKNPFNGTEIGQWYHMMVEARKKTYIFEKFLGDPDKDPTINEWVKNIINKTTAKTLFEDLDPYKPSTDTDQVRYAQMTMSGTEQISVIDTDEMFVSVSTSLNDDFGSKVITDRGIILNSHLADFSDNSSAGFAANFPSRGKRPLSAMAPTIVFHSKRICGKRLAIGATNGTAGLTGLAQIILNLTLSKDAVTNITQMIEEPRFHATAKPNIVYVEDITNQSLASKLNEKGLNNNASLVILKAVFGSASNQSLDSDMAEIVKQIRDKKDIATILEIMGHQVERVPRGKINSVNLVMKINENFFAIGDPRSADMGVNY